MTWLILSRTRQHWLQTPFCYPTPLRKQERMSLQVTAIATSGTQCGETTGKEETKAQLASLQMPHLKARIPTSISSYNHDLDNCPNFAKKAIEERRLFVQEARLCFGCLCLGHVSKRCRNRKVCKSCIMPHPTVLHDETKSTLRLMKVQQVKKLPELLSQKKPQAAAQVPAMQLEPSTLSQTQ